MHPLPCAARPDEVAGRQGRAGRRDRCGQRRGRDPEEVADTIGRALEFVPKERLFPCTNCGLAPMARDVAWRKLEALAEGTRLARERLTTA